MIQLYEKAAECCETLDFEQRSGETAPKGEKQGGTPFGAQRATRILGLLPHFFL